MTTKALLVTADGEVLQIDLPSEDADIVIHHKVGGWFDVVGHPSRKIHAYVHDEGIIRDLRPNVVGTYLFGQLLVGDIVISGTTPSGEESDFIVPQEIADIYKKLNTDEDAVERLMGFTKKVRDMGWQITVE